MPYINITENGAGKILFSKVSENFEGLAITNLTTCTAILIIGDEALVLIHDEGFLSIESIREMFDAVGTLKQWSIFYNPNALKGEELQARIAEMQLLMDHYGDKYISGDDAVFRKTEERKVIIDNAYKNVSQVRKTGDIELAQPFNVTVRNGVRRINNLYAEFNKRSVEFGHRMVPLDVQYDGESQIEFCATLLCTRDQAIDCIRKDAQKLRYRRTESHPFMKFLATIDEVGEVDFASASADTDSFERLSLIQFEALSKGEQTSYNEQLFHHLKLKADSGSRSEKRLEFLISLAEQLCEELDGQDAKETYGEYKREFEDRKDTMFGAGAGKAPSP